MIIVLLLRDCSHWTDSEIIFIYITMYIRCLNSRIKLEMFETEYFFLKSCFSNYWNEKINMTLGIMEEWWKLERNGLMLWRGDVYFQVIVFDLDLCYTNLILNAHSLSKRSLVVTQIHYIACRDDHLSCLKTSKLKSENEYKLAISGILT